MTARHEAQLPALLISDLHLDIMKEERAEKIYAALGEILPEIKQIFILGDILQSPDDPESRERAEHVVARFAEAVGDIRIVYMNGNHDMIFQEEPFDLPLKVEQFQGLDMHAVTNRGVFCLSHGHEWDPTIPMKRSKSVIPVKLQNKLMHDIGQPLYLKIQDQIVAALGPMLPDSWKMVNESRAAMPMWMDDLFMYQIARKFRKTDYAGIIQGHTHIPYMRTVEGRPYVNTGDWQDHATVTIWREDCFVQKELLTGDEDVLMY